MQELSAAGRSSLHPHAESIHFRIYGAPLPERKEQVQNWFVKAREAADQREDSRWAYVREGLAEGRHPDTDPSFWMNWNEPKFPSLPGMSFREFTSPEGLFKLALIALVIFFITLLLISALRRRRKRRLLKSIEVVGMNP